MRGHMTEPSKDLSCSPRSPRDVNKSQVLPRGKKKAARPAVRKPAINIAAKPTQKDLSQESNFDLPRLRQHANLIARSGLSGDDKASARRASRSVLQDGSKDSTDNRDIMSCLGSRNTEQRKDLNRLKSSWLE